MEFGQHGNPTQRLTGIGFVVLLHAALIYGLVTGLARKAVELLPEPIETEILEEPVLEREPPAPPPPELEIPPLPFIPPPEIVIQQPIAPPPAAITAVTNTPVPADAVRAVPVINAKRRCRDPEYPAIAERLGETGTVQLAMLIGVDGRVIESRVEKSSGYPRLDKAAHEALSRCLFVPGKVNGVPEQAWAKIKYTFRKRK